MTGLVKQGQAPCRLPLLQQNLSFVTIEFHTDHTTLTMIFVKSGHPQFSGNYRI